MGVLEYKPLDMNALIKALEEITLKQVSSKQFNFYTGSEGLDMMWDIIGRKKVDLYGVKALGFNLYEAIVFDDISEYNKFNLVVYSNSAELKPPICIELDDFEKVTDALVRFSVNHKFVLEYSTWKLECYK